MSDRVPSDQASEASHHSYDVAIVGAGVVGCTLAFGLGRSGRKVLLVERDLSYQDRIVGELLQPGGCASLAQLGMLDCLSDIDSRLVRGYEVYWGAKHIPIPYPAFQNDSLVLDFGDDGLSGEVGKKMPADDQGHARGRSFHHGSFVQALRHKVATDCPNVTLVEGTVNDVIRTASGRIQGVLVTPSTKAVLRDCAQIASTSKLSSPEPLEFKAHLTFISDGHGSKFRRMILPADAPQPITRSHFVGLMLKDAELPSPGHGHVILSESSKQQKEYGGPVLVYQLSKHDTRMLVDVPGPKLPSIANGDLKAHLIEHVLPALPSCLVPSFQNAINSTEKEGRLRSMPNSYLPAFAQHRSDVCTGCIMVGDALNMRHPLTGGGMTVGIGDAVILTQLFGANADTSTVKTVKVMDLANDEQSIREAVEDWHWRRKGLTGTINVLAQALYSLFAAQDDDLEVLKEGCFKYFLRGGQCVDGPVSLMSGILASPATLFYHFFSVAFFAIYLLFTSARSNRKGSPSPAQWPALFLQSLSVIWKACVVFLPVIGKELLG